MSVDDSIDSTELYADDDHLDGILQCSYEKILDDGAVGFRRSARMDDADRMDRVNEEHEYDYEDEDEDENDLNDILRCSYERPGYTDGVLPREFVGEPQKDVHHAPSSSQDPLCVSENTGGYLQSKQQSDYMNHELEDLNNISNIVGGSSASGGDISCHENQSENIERDSSGVNTSVSNSNIDKENGKFNNIGKVDDESSVSGVDKGISESDKLRLDRKKIISGEGNGDEVCLGVGDLSTTSRRNKQGGSSRASALSHGSRSRRGSRKHTNRALKQNGSASSRISSGATSSVGKGSGRNGEGGSELDDGENDHSDDYGVKHSLYATILARQMRTSKSSEGESQRRGVSHGGALHEDEAPGDAFLGNAAHPSILDDYQESITPVSSIEVPTRRSSAVHSLHEDDGDDVVSVASSVTHSMISEWRVEEVTNQHRQERTTSYTDDTIAEEDDAPIDHERVNSPLPQDTLRGRESDTLTEQVGEEGQEQQPDEEEAVAGQNPQDGGMAASFTNPPPLTESVENVISADPPDRSHKISDPAAKTYDDMISSKADISADVPTTVPEITTKTHHVKEEPAVYNDLDEEGCSHNEKEVNKEVGNRIAGGRRGDKGGLDLSAKTAVISNTRPLPGIVEDVSSLESPCSNTNAQADNATAATSVASTMVQPPSQIPSIAQRYNGWNVPLGVHRVVCSAPGLRVSTQIHRQSSPVIVPENIDIESEPGEVVDDTRELIIPPGSFAEVLETRVHGERVRGRVCWEIEDYEEEELGSAKGDGKKTGKKKGAIKKARNVIKKQTSSMLKSKRHSSKSGETEDISSAAARRRIVRKYEGWISLQWADEERDCDNMKQKGAITDNDGGPWTKPVLLGVYRISSKGGLPLYESPEPDSTRIGRLDRGQCVEVTQAQVSFDQVVRARVILPEEDDDHVTGEKFSSGWINLMSAQTKSSSSVGATLVPLGAYVIVADDSEGCVVTEGSRLDSKEKGKLSPGSSMEVVATRMEKGVVRGLIASGGHVSLFVPSRIRKAVSFDDTADKREGEQATKEDKGQMFAMPVPLGKYRVVEDGLKLTADISSSSSLVMNLSQNTIVEILETHVVEGKDRVRGRIGSVANADGSHPSSGSGSGWITLFEVRRNRMRMYAHPKQQKKK